MIKKFPKLIEIFKVQKWIDFLGEHRVYYPRLVAEFYQNLKYDEDQAKLFSKVKGSRIEVSKHLLHTVFRIPEEGETESKCAYDFHDAYSLITDERKNPQDKNQLKLGQFNASNFSPLKRLLHHILTAMITPQVGGRGRLTNTLRFVLYYLLKRIRVYLPKTIIQIMSTCKESRRHLPYAVHLTTIFMKANISLENEPSKEIPKVNVYNMDFIKKYLKLKDTDSESVSGEIQRKNKSEKHESGRTLRLQKREYDG